MKLFTSSFTSNRVERTGKFAQETVTMETYIFINHILQFSVYLTLIYLYWLFVMKVILRTPSGNNIGADFHRRSPAGSNYNLATRTQVTVTLTVLYFHRRRVTHHQIPVRTFTFLFKWGATARSSLGRASAFEAAVAFSLASQR